MLVSQNFPKVQKFSYVEDPRAKTAYFNPFNDFAPDFKSSSKELLNAMAWWGGFPFPVVEVRMKTKVLSARIMRFFSTVMI